MGKRARNDDAVEESRQPAKRAQQQLYKPNRPQTKEYWQAHFSDGLFDALHIAAKRTEYAKSRPYKHAVIDGLINDELLRGVRNEVLSEIHYTQKETDIYKIHQSGDLANLDGLDDASLAKLPNLLKLRNALYSPPFRDYLQEITQCGKLSGEKTDMAINIYTPGSHLLCHDDVIGSRRISYILYLTDPNDPWKEEWGGALRLYPTREYSNSDGEVSHIPQPNHSKVIFPAWNQLSFFAVQPGQSFHDVGEVFEADKVPKFRQPMRVAISGWFHIPQEGEAGFIEGEAEALQKESSLTTLQSSDEQFDYPKPDPVPYPEYDPQPLQPFQPRRARTEFQVEEDEKLESEWLKKKKLIDQYHAGEEDPDHDVLTEDEIEFLTKFINPNYLGPDQAEVMNDSFQENGQIVLKEFLCTEFGDALAHYIHDHFPRYMSDDTKKIEKDLIWTVAKPPHKHKYLFMDASSINPGSQNLLTVRAAVQNECKRVLNLLFKSLAFRKWLQIISGLIVKSYDIRIRRFRHGIDYQLAKLYKEDEARLELTLGLTLGGKWEKLKAENAHEARGDDYIRKCHAKQEAKEKKKWMKQARTNWDPVVFEPLSWEMGSDLTNNGGYEMFIRGDEDVEDDIEEHGHAHPDITGKQKNKTKSDPVGKQKKKNKSDPAVYKAPAEDEDDGILLNMTPDWNKLSIVLRDKGTMRFVKYVSARSDADRWDLAGEWEVDWKRSAKVHGWEDEDEEEEGDGEGDGDARMVHSATDDDDLDDDDLDDDDLNDDDLDDETDDSEGGDVR